MARKPPGPAQARALAGSILLLAAAPVPAETPRGEVSSLLLPDTMVTRIGLRPGRGSSFLGLALEAKPEGAALAACLSLGGGGEAGPSLEAGPGAVSGGLLLLADPTAATAISPGRPVRADRSLGSRKAVLGLGAGPFTLFAAAQGEGAPALAARPTFEGASSPILRSQGPAAGGLSIRRSLPGGWVEAIAAASFRPRPKASGGWEADLVGSPALQPWEGELPLAGASLAYGRGDGADRALAGLAFSWGRLSGPGLALRLEAWRSGGGLSLSLSAAAAGPGYKGLFGEAQRRLASASAGARLALRRSASISARLEAEASSKGRAYAPAWEERPSLSLSLPLGGSGRALLATRLSAPLRPSAADPGRWEASISGRRDEEGGSSSSRLAAAIDWGRAFGGLELAFGSSTRAEGGRPSLGLELGLSLFEGGHPGSPVLAKGGAALALPFGPGGSVSLEARLPEGGLALAPAGTGRGGKAAPVLSLGYVAELGAEASARRPRSRSSRRPKASSSA